MPIYEYQCNACGYLFDVMQKMSDAPETICPECSKDSVVRLVSAAGFQLKGTGWYVTDFKNKAPAKETKPADTTGKNSSTPSPTNTGSATSTETKTTAKDSSN